MSNGLVIYRGPSMLDGAPIVAIATGLGKASTNAKTGAMVQIWIMREDVSPRDAVNSGADSSVCGDCVHRGSVVDGKNVNRSCYVTIIHAPRNVWSSYHRGIYPFAGWETGSLESDLESLFEGRAVRLGAYGDPAAVPMRIWDAVTKHAAYFTGYTHQWKRFPELARYCMASCDSELERELARVLGFRAFRVRRMLEPTLPGEVKCPASAEMGKKTNCNACRACGGLSAKARADIVIVAHGSPATHFERAQAH
jgi:hypothetical protein